MNHNYVLSLVPHDKAGVWSSGLGILHGSFCILPSVRDHLGKGMLCLKWLEEERKF